MLFPSASSLQATEISKKSMQTIGCARAPETKKIIYQSHFFYEYEPHSGVIVKFRYEEKVKDACQIPGV